MSPPLYPPPRPALTQGTRPPFHTHNQLPPVAPQVLLQAARHAAPGGVQGQAGARQAGLRQGVGGAAGARAAAARGARARARDVRAMAMPGRTAQHSMSQHTRARGRDTHHTIGGPGISVVGFHLHTSTIFSPNPQPAHLTFLGHGLCTWGKGRARCEAGTGEAHLRRRRAPPRCGRHPGTRPTQDDS